MSMRIFIRFALVTLLMIAFTAALAAAPRNPFNNERPVKGNHHTITAGSHSLDEDYTQLRYLKTTDYGHTWTSFTQAGDMSAVEAFTGSPGDFSGIVTATNELCYAIVLNGDLYTFTGPDFSGVMAAAAGDNAFDGNGAGWADACRSPNGDLIVITWGHDVNGANSVWAVKSTDNGASWGTPWMVLTEPTLSADAQYFHLADMTSADYAFMQFQIPGTDGHDQYVCRFPTAGGTGTITNLNAYSGTEFSYYTGNCTPIKYDPTYTGGGAQGALYACFRNADLSGTAVYYSGDMGMTFNPASITGAQRYPAPALNAATSTPWVISNFGVPTDPGEHCAWYSYDEFGYDGGAWTEPADLTCTPFDGGDYFLFYMNQGYWWDADRGCVSLNLWGVSTPEGINATYTTDGGATWADNMALFYYLDDLIGPASVQNCELEGGSDGVAYILTSGQNVSDLVAPTVGPIELLSDITDPPPYAFRAMYTDNTLMDTVNCWINWGDESGVTIAYMTPDSFQFTNVATLSGWFYYTLPDTALGGLQQGESVYIYFDGYDAGGNYSSSEESVVIVGQEWQDVPEQVNNIPAAFELKGNYPNPFNPTTRIEFTVPSEMTVNLKVYNTLGQLVETLANKLHVSAGTYSYEFNAANLPSGVYIYQLSNGINVDAKKMVLVK